jgi:hypothetical protein
MFDGEAFKRASLFLNNSARPLDRALFACHFAGGSRDLVIAELAKFQNADGGFQSLLESDTRWSGSSPLGAMKGLRILNEVGAPPGDSRVSAVIHYLLQTFDSAKGCWHALPAKANEAPHAIWWDVRAETGNCEVESSVFPTAAIAGYLGAYSTLLPAGFLARITNASLDYLEAAPLDMKMPDLESLVELVRLLPAEQTSVAVQKLRSVLAKVVVEDREKWNSYNVKPLTFVHTPESPLYAGPQKAVSANLDYLISTQQADGGWALTWSWEERDPAAWKVAEKEWRGVVTLENLETLESFHRIAR